MMDLARQFYHPAFHFFAPQAASRIWYHFNGFRHPIARNQRYIDSALGVITDLLTQLQAGGIPRQMILLLGFSQGACLVLEYALRYPMRYGGIISMSGGLLGPMDATREVHGSLEQTPIFLGHGAVDTIITTPRIEWTGRLLTGMGADIQTKVYPKLGHSTNSDEIAVIRNMMGALVPWKSTI